MNDTTIIPPLPTSTELAVALAELIDVINIKAPVPENRSDAMARVIALERYLLALRLSVVTGDRNAMFDRLSLGVAECRKILEPTTYKDPSHAG
jgi:hypothetical protein